MNENSGEISNSFLLANPSYLCKTSLMSSIRNNANPRQKTKSIDLVPNLLAGHEELLNNYSHVFDIMNENEIELYRNNILGSSFSFAGKSLKEAIEQFIIG